MTTFATTAPLKNTAQQDRLYYWIRTALIFVSLYSLVDFFLRYTVGKLPHLESLAGAWKELLLIVLYALWYARRKTYGQTAAQTTRLHWMILITFIAALLSIVSNYLTGGSPSLDVKLDQWVTVHESLGVALLGLRTLLESSLYFFVLVGLIEDDETLLEMANLFLFSAVLIAIYGVYQRLSGMKTPASWVYSDAEGGATRIFSTINNPNDLGGLMVLTAPIAISFALFSKNLRDRIIYGAAAILLLVCMMYTLSRGSWIGFLCGVLLYVVMTKNWKLLGVLVVVVAAVSFLMPNLAHRLILVFQSSYLAKARQAGRLQFWNRSFQIWMHRPVFGAGLGLVGDSVAIVKKIPGATWIDNQYVKLLAETGLVGLVSYVAMLLTPVIRGWQWMTRHNQRGTFHYALITGLLAAIFGMIVENFVEGIFETWVISTYFWMVVAMLYAAIRISAAESKTSSK